MLSIVIPTYNERGNIGKLINSVENVLRKNRISGELIVVDDSSNDGTTELLKTLKRKFRNIRLHIRKERGIGSALRLGYELARKKYVLAMDADFSHNPKDIPKFLKEIENADIIVGSRYVPKGKIENWSLRRRILSLGANLLASAVLGLNVKDATSGYRLFRKDVLRDLDLKADGFVIQVESLYKAKKKGYVIKEMPISFKDRVKARSKLKFSEKFKFFYYILKLRFA